MSIMLSTGLFLIDLISPSLKKKENSFPNILLTESNSELSKNLNFRKEERYLYSF